MVKLKRDHGYSHQLRVKHERAMNKYGKSTGTRFITKGIYYITKKLQINLILNVSSPQREYQIEHHQIF